ncbi:MAG: EamA family transporter [Anaerolineaceae bacterium]|mgnify:CR=1 FL=1|nr:EamA family transporter [Anaerolineaceae bacterium]
MAYLFIVSLIWAFSFGLIKGNLTGVDSNFVGFARLLISFLIFLPFLKIKKINGRLALKLLLTGMLQFGIMYLTYLAAFRTLKAYEVALFTIFTPIFVTLIDDAFARKFNFLHLATAIITVAGTWVIKRGEIQSPGVMTGFLLVQISNLCYAFGQVYYRKLMAKDNQLKDRDVFGYMYLGAVVVTALATGILVPISTITLTAKQIWTILYLGAVASGISFFLWNIGARKVNAGTLAIFNDLKIPLAVTVSLLVFGEKTNIPSLLIGGTIILIALALNEYFSRKQRNVIQS